MSRQTFIWGISHDRVRPEERWLELLCILGLLLAALILYTINLGSLPLRDWDEGTVAQVATEIYHAPLSELKWLFPTIWGEPYLNKPPLIHNLMALVYSVLGVSEFSSRIVGASLSAFAVPLLYCIGRELFLPRYYALFSALVYLTTFPVVRHGRLAMLDGAVMCFGMLMMWCLLKSRRDLRWALGAGIGFGLICLSKGWMMGLLLGAIAFLFVAWDTPRLVSSIYLWFGVLVGSMPVIMWQTSQWLHYGKNFVNTAILDQSLDRIYIPVEGHAGPPWYYLLELLKYPHPWLFLSLFGFGLAWQHRNWSWGKLILIWVMTYLIVVSAMMTKLPWYIMPIYPAIALGAGVALAEVKSLPNHRRYPSLWVAFFALLSLAIGGGIVYFILFGTKDYGLLVILGLVGLTMAITAVMISKRDSQFIIVLFWGMYVGLLLFFSSDSWLWELNEAFPVKPVANLVKNYVTSNEKVYTSFAYERPSFNFYSEHKVDSLSQVVGEKDKPWQNITEFWQDKNNKYLLINKTTNPEILTELNLSNLKCQYNLEEVVKSEHLQSENDANSSHNLCLTHESTPDWLLLYKTTPN